MKKFAKLLALVLVCVMMVSAFVACGNSSDTETQPEETKAKTPETSNVGGDRYDASFDRTSVKDDVPTDLTFNGETVTFFVRNAQEIWQYEMDVDAIMNDTLYDAIYYRNKTVEERLGITINTIGQSGTYDSRAAWNDTLRTAVNTKLTDFDAAAIYMSTGSALAVEGVYYNVIDFPNINLEKPWWNQSIQDELTMFNTLYYLAGDIAITETAGTFCMAYNKNLYDKYYGASGENLYEVVDDNRWTIDYLYNLAAGVHEDVNGDGLISDGDVIGYSASDPDKQDSWNDAWIAACGISITTKVNGVPELSFFSERTVRAHEKVYKLSVTCPGTLAQSTKELTTFADGKILFTRADLNSGSGWREMKDTYGILPYPMLEEGQEGGYSTITTNNASLITILSSLPSARKALIGATLELMAAESYKQVTPTYFEVALKTKYASDLEDAKMYDLIINSVRFNFGYCYSTETLRGASGCLSIGSLFRIISDDLAQKYEQSGEAYEQNLQKLIDGLDEASFKASYGE